VPYCPQCLAEYRDGFTRCATCDVDLVEQLGEEMVLTEENIRRALEGKELLGVARGELEVVKETRALLSRARIASVIIEDEQAQLPAGMAPRVVLLVSKDDLEQAQSVLGEKFQQMLEAEGQPPPSELEYGKCPACGTTIPEDAEECPECGLFVGQG